MPGKMLFGHVSLGVLGSRKICHPQVVSAEVPNFGLTLLHLAGHVLSKAFLFDWQVSRCRLVHCLKGLNKACANHSFGSAILQVAQVTCLQPTPQERAPSFLHLPFSIHHDLRLERTQVRRKSGLRPGTVPSACGHRTLESYISSSWILQVQPLKERMKIGQVISQIKAPTLVSKGYPP